MIHNCAIIGLSRRLRITKYRSVENEANQAIACIIVHSQGVLVKVERIQMYSIKKRQKISYRVHSILCENNIDSGVST